MEQIVSLEVARLAREIGFDFMTTSYYEYRRFESNKPFEWQLTSGERQVTNYMFPESTLVVAPSQVFLAKWIREKHDIHVMIGIDDLNWWYQLYDCSEEGRMNEHNYLTISTAGRTSYEEAMEGGLRVACEMIKGRMQ